MSKGKRGNKYGPKIGGWGNAKLTQEKSITVCSSAISTGKMLHLSTMQKGAYRSALIKVMKACAQKSWHDSSASANMFEFYSLLANVRMHALLTGVIVTFKFPKLHIQTSINLNTTPVHLFLLYNLIVIHKEQLVIDVDLPLMEITPLSAFSERYMWRPAYTTILSAEEVEGWLRNRDLLYVTPDRELNVLKYGDSIENVLCYSWNLYTTHSLLYGHSYQESPSLVFRNVDGAWTMITTYRSEIKFIDTATSAVYNKGLDWKESLSNALF